MISWSVDDSGTTDDPREREQRLVRRARTCVDLLPADSALARLADSEFAICVVHDDYGPPGQAAALIDELRRHLPDASIAAATAPAPAPDVAALRAQASSRLASVRRSEPGPARRSDHPDMQ